MGLRRVPSGSPVTVETGVVDELVAEGIADVGVDGTSVVVAWTFLVEAVDRFGVVSPDDSCAVHPSVPLKRRPASSRVTAWPSMRLAPPRGYVTQRGQNRQPEPSEVRTADLRSMVLLPSGSVLGDYSLPQFGVYAQTAERTNGRPGRAQGGLALPGLVDRPDNGEARTCAAIPLAARACQC
jgi:hypothetical protein